MKVKSDRRCKFSNLSNWKEEFLKLQHLLRRSLTLLSCNISKTNASVSSGVPNTEKQMKARGRMPSAFIVSRCLEPLLKHEARVFGIAS